MTTVIGKKKVDEKAENVWNDKTEYEIKSIACSQMLDIFVFIVFIWELSIVFV